MENFKKARIKIANVMARIYGIGIFVALFVGAISFLGYLVAIIIGGDTATEICVFIYKKFYPVLFTFSSCIVLFGLLKMYVAGEKSLSPKKNKLDEKKPNSKDETDKKTTEN